MRHARSSEERVPDGGARCLQSEREGGSARLFGERVKGTPTTGPSAGFWYGLVVGICHGEMPWCVSVCAVLLCAC